MLHDLLVNLHLQGATPWDLGLLFMTSIPRLICENAILQKVDSVATFGFGRIALQVPVVLVVAGVTFLNAYRVKRSDETVAYLAPHARPLLQDSTIDPRHLVAVQLQACVDGWDVSFNRKVPESRLTVIQVLVKQRLVVAGATVSHHELRHSLEVI